MSRRMRRLSGWLALLVFLLCALPSGATGADDPWEPFDTPWFDRLGIADGLPHSITTAVVQDRQGLVWIGTMGGLVRYDGYRLQVFADVAGRAPGLPDAYVRCLLALPDGGLLIGTNAGGLSRFDPAGNRFRNYPVGDGGTVDRKIYALADDGGHGVWIATEHGLDHLDLASDRIEHVATGDGPAPRSFSVLQDRAGNLWLGNNAGLFVRRAGTREFVRPPRPREESVAIVLADQIWALREDREGRLWAGSVQAGAAWRDPDGGWHAVPGFSGYQADHARRATVRDFQELASGTMWIATDGSGVLAYAPGAAAVREIGHDTAMPSSLPGDSVRALMLDRSGNVWAATDLGVAHTHPDARTAFALLPSMREAHALANTNVRGIYVDRRKRIWLGLSAGRIDVIDLAAGQIRHLELDGSQRRRDVQAFAETPDGAIWVGTQGLARVDPDSLAVQDSVLPALDDAPVLHLLADGERLLIATYDGAYRYDLRTRALQHLEHAERDPGSLAGNTVRSIARVGGAIWYLTGRGISIAADAGQDRGFVNLAARPGDPHSLPANPVSSVAVDPAGRVWVGTAGGLGLLDAPAPPYRFRRFGTADGLDSDNVNAVLSDDRGNLWLSLPNGIAMIDGASHAVHTLGIRDGLRIPSYIYAAATRAPGGELLFGGLGGLTVIRPGWQPPPVPDAPLAVSQAVVNGAPLPFGQLPRPGDTLTLAPRKRSLRVDFALLDYQAPSETTYGYRMEGFDEGWIEMPRGSLPSAIYTNLPHGEYTLRLRAQTRGMRPRTVETAFSVRVEPRWYETAAARLVAVLLLFLLVVGLVQLRTLYLRRQARQLQRQIDMHTHELLEANRRLDELASTDELTGACNRRRFLELAEGIRQTAQDGHACMALLDLDRFKRINDTYGHLAGDAVIRGAARSILRQCRAGDLAGRYGGEELVVCLPDCALADGMAIAERIRASLAAGGIAHGGQTLAVTASIGVAAYRKGESLAQWLSRADGALYEAKRAGRNRCVAAP
jgi:diguanylate cyclase (GGDEF)-like protein